MENTFIALIVYEQDNKPLRKLYSLEIKNLIENFSINSKINYKSLIKRFIEYKESKEIPYYDGYFCFKLYDYKGKCEKGEDPYCFLKDHFIFEIKFISDMANRKLEHIRSLCLFVRDFFTITNGLYSCFRFEPDNDEYFPTSEDLKNGIICYWVYQNLLSRRLNNRIRKGFLPPYKKFSVNQFGNGGIEYSTRNENGYGFFSHISNKKFLDKRFYENRLKNNISTQELEVKINKILERVMEHSGTNIDELRALGLEKARYNEILMKIAKYRLDQYRKSGGLGNIFDADAIYGELKIPDGSNFIIREYIRIYEENPDNREDYLENIRSHLEDIPAAIKIIKKNDPALYKKMKELHIEFHE